MNWLPSIQPPKQIWMSPLVIFLITWRLRQGWADDLGLIGSRWDGFTNQALIRLFESAFGGRQDSAASR